MFNKAKMLLKIKYKSKLPKHVMYLNLNSIFKY